LGFQIPASWFTALTYCRVRFSFVRLSSRDLALHCVSSLEQQQVRLLLLCGHGVCVQRLFLELWMKVCRTEAKRRSSWGKVSETYTAAPNDHEAPRISASVPIPTYEANDCCITFLCWNGGLIPCLVHLWKLCHLSFHIIYHFRCCFFQ
jgi:hypothetical protein